MYPVKWFMLLCVLVVVGCAAPPVPVNDNDRSKALVLLSDSAPGLLVVAALPLNSYCRMHTWPSPQGIDVPPLLQKTFLHLKYAQDSVEGYNASFQLNSRIPNDFFTTTWFLHIVTPTASAEDQSIILRLEEPNFSIYLTHTMTLNCDKVMRAS